MAGLVEVLFCGDEIEEDRKESWGWYCRGRKGVGSSHFDWELTWLVRESRRTSPHILCDIFISNGK